MYKSYQRDVVMNRADDSNLDAYLLSLRRYNKYESRLAGGLGWEHLIQPAQVRQRIDVLTVLMHLKVKVRAGREAGRAHQADDLATSHPLAGLHQVLRAVPVERKQIGGVLHHHHVAVALVGPTEYNGAVLGNVDGVACAGGNINSGVELVFLGNRVGSPAKGRGHFSVGGRVSVGVCPNCYGKAQETQQARQ